MEDKILQENDDVNYPPDDMIAATLGPFKYKGEDNIMFTIYKGKSNYSLPIVLGDGDQASNLAMCGFNKHGKPRIGYFILDAKFKDGVKPGTSDISIEDQVEEVIGTKVMIEFHSKQVVADLITSLQSALNMWGNYDEREEE